MLKPDIAPLFGRDRRINRTAEHTFEVVLAPDDVIAQNSPFTYTWDELGALHPRLARACTAHAVQDAQSQKELISRPFGRGLVAATWLREDVFVVGRKMY